MKKLLLILAGALALASCSPKQESAEWHSVAPEELSVRPINLFAQRWMALSTGDRTEANSMTIAWGTIGELWGKNVVIVYVSSDRYTKHLMDKNEFFTVTAFPEDEKCQAALRYLGSASGRNEDKMKGCGLTVEYTGFGNPIFAEGNLAIECRTIYSEPFKLELMPEWLRDGMYSDMGVHSFYVGEIVNIWEK